MNENRDFKGIWIPKEIWLDERLNALDKVILAEIDSLDNGEDGCWAGNEYLAKFCQCSIRKVTGAVSKLVKVGYIEVVSFDGRKRKIKSRVAKSTEQTGKNCEADWQKVRTIKLKNNKDIKYK